MHPIDNLVADTICRTAELGLTITDAADAVTLTIINANPVAVTDTCPDCRMPGVKRDYIRRQLVDLPIVGFPSHLHVRTPASPAPTPACSKKNFQTSLPGADDGAKLTHRVRR